MLDSKAVEAHVVVEERILQEQKLLRVQVARRVDLYVVLRGPGVLLLALRLLSLRLRGRLLLLLFLRLDLLALVVGFAPPPAVFWLFLHAEVD